MAAEPVVPRFYLYGEPHRSAIGQFVHVENLYDRSRPSEWTIVPHAHAELNHIFHIRSGGGTLRAEYSELSFTSPCLIVVPAAVVHGFAWQLESVGSVITVSSIYLQRLADCDQAIGALFRSVAVTALEEEGSAAVAAAAASLMSELAWSAPGHRAAVEALLLSLAVQTLRALGAHDACSAVDAGLAPEGGSRAALVARLRERIEARFRLREPVAAYAAALNTSETRLRDACARVAGQSPMQMLDQRAMLEAQRALFYSNLSIGQIAEGLGFDDAAYFSRFFTRYAGISPRSHRQQHHDLV